MNCQWTEQLQAYHDGELPADTAALLRSHLAACPACQAELDALRQVSELISSRPMSIPPVGYADRMAQLVMAANSGWDASVGRLTGWLTAAAAVLLLAVQFMAPLAVDDSSVSTATNASMTDSNVQLAAWEVAATSPPRPQREGGNGELARAAEWIASDLAMATPAQ